MGWICGTYGGEGEMHTEFWWGDLYARDHMMGR